METLRYCFDHPVAVKVFFNCLSDPAIRSDIKFLRSDEEGCLEIPVDNIPEGKWKVMLEWNYDGRDFCMEKNVKLPARVLS